MLLIYIFPFSTDKHFKLIKSWKSFLPFEKSLLIYRFHNIWIKILTFSYFYRDIIENSIMQMMSNL